jgi:hypothetical protein
METQVKQPEVSTNGNGNETQSQLDSLLNVLNKKSGAIREERKQQRLKEGKPENLTGEAAVMENAYVLDLTIKDLAKTSSNLGQVMLAGLWQMQVSGYYRIFEEETLGDWARNHIGEHLDVWYVRSLAKAAETILAYVYAAEKADKPILDPDTQLPITVNLLLTKPGLISKLKENADHFATLKTDKQRDEMVATIATKSRTDVKAKKAKQKSENGKIPIFKAFEKYNAKTQKTTLTLKDLDDAQLAHVKKVLAKYLDIHLEA